ncbi:hypothetical protein ACIRU8_40215 [Streptomyces sp. NPDC101175]
MAFVAAVILWVWDGKRLSVKVSEHTLQRIFALVLRAVAAFTLIGASP